MRLTAEKKRIIIEDITPRLQHGVKMLIYDDTTDRTATLTGIDSNRGLYFGHRDAFYGWKSYVMLPYLRPMDSITDKEQDELVRMKYGFISRVGNRRQFCLNYTSYKVWDILNMMMLDYRGLIPARAALPAPECMYENKVKKLKTK